MTRTGVSVDASNIPVGSASNTVKTPVVTPTIVVQTGDASNMNLYLGIAIAAALAALAAAIPVMRKRRNN